MAGKLPDAFLKDLEELSDDEQAVSPLKDKGDLPAGDFAQFEEVSKLKTDENYQRHLENIQNDLNTVHPADRFINLGKSDPIYDFIKKSNQYLVEIEEEITILHKEIRDIYMSKFSELESIVYDPIEYAKCVKKIGAEKDLTKVDFQGILPNQTIMNITVAASMNRSNELPPKRLEKLLYYCDDILMLNEHKKLILNYLENRMHYIAPNVNELLGCSVTAKLVAAAGGVTELANIPASNVQVLGAQKKSLQGFSTASLNLHVGHIGEVAMVQNAPQSYKKQITRMFSTKTVLAARVDATRKHPSGEEGRKLLGQIKARFGKILEPALPPMKKPLPKPIDKPSRKRGGRKFGNMKKRLQMTEYKKMLNTLPFGTEAQEEIGDTGIGLGMIGMKGTGKLRAIGDKEQKIKLMQKKNKKTPQPLAMGTIHNGLVSSLALASTEGIELINPELLKKKVNEQETYFNAKSGFTTVIASKKSQG
jgi:U4/U6 small nuclear ribonucleoprotein PRP31